MFVEWKIEIRQQALTQNPEFNTNPDSVNSAKRKFSEANSAQILLKKIRALNPP